MTFRNLKNLTTWANSETLEAWNKQRLLESSDPEKPIGWSEWIQTKVTMGLNINQLPNDNGDNAYQLKAILHNKQIEIEKLNKRILELGSKEIGVSDDRILRILQKGKYLLFDEIVQELINTEAENAFNTLQKLALSDVIESDKSGNRWRLKS
jgi:hypothetical protein